MVIFKAFAVVCALAVPQDQCRVENDNQLTIFAYELPLQKDEQHNNIACVRRSLFIMGPLGIAPRDGVEYMKLMCVRSGSDDDADVG